ncbi:MAG: LysE family translocator [Rhodobacteraceae bacterium]|nr:LysE family translocator [Paracoccaceae bacterium]
MDPALSASSVFEWERLTVLAGFAFASTWTPGPNNIMLANSGATFGYRASQPHAFGVALGFPVMMFFIALGLGELFKASPLFRELLKWAGAALMIYLGWRVATAGRASEGSMAARPFTFVEAAGFQWINPKAWTMAIGVASLFISGGAPVAEALLCALVFVVSGLGSSQTWTVFGAAIRRFLSTEARLRAFNIAMGVLVAGCAVFLFAGG